MSESPQQKPLKSTLNLPETSFAMKANLPQNEPARLEDWHKINLYGQIRAARAGAPKYILHDGPPYANGAIHLGHALNKCIKDFVVKTKTMAGFDAPYVPGWDCHGLPIEIKVDEQLGRKKLEMPAVSVRRACREYAQKYVDLQSTQFQRIGVFGRWDNPYKTMSFDYEASILETFYAFFEQGFVYKGLKPVFWCLHDRTALAEAEVEYETHTSPSIYVRYALTSDPAAIHPALAGRQVYTIIWTTTPWTIPASQAVAFHPTLEYVALEAVSTDITVPHSSQPHRDESESQPPVYLIAQALLSSVIGHCHLMSPTNPEEPASQTNILAVFTGQHLEHATFQHPFYNRSILGTVADYVTADQGTGAVHTAPAHGVDDFQTGKRYNLPELQYISHSGHQLNTGGMPFEGLALFESNPVITELLRERGALLSATSFQHSYPHCWRCHNPVVVRATEQWFIGMETPMPSPEGTTTFRKRALEAIQQVTWDPAWGEERISNMIATRPDWCISRQRIWGVPIAVFLCEKCAQPLNDPAINASIVERFRKESADAWYTHSAEALLPPGTTCTGCGHTIFRKEMDILDVWFESGASWHAVLDHEPELTFPADLYTEGGDQHRGWFHSSLLTSVALRGRAPYKNVATSGWTLDEQGRAFSKSLGNGVDPVDVAKRLGGEIIRLWVASVDFREDVAASESLMQRVSDNYRKLRNTFKFLLGNIYDFNPTIDAVPFAEMQPLDQYILARLDLLVRSICGYKEEPQFIQLGNTAYAMNPPDDAVGWYAQLEFHRVYHSLNEFVNTELSALYLDAVKDRLYTFPVTFKPDRPYQKDLYTARRSAQTALWRIAETLTRLIAPILSFTAEEIWSHLPHVPTREPSVHLSLFPDLSDIGDQTTLLAEWDHLLFARTVVLKQLEGMRQRGEIGKALEADLLDTSGLETELSARFDPNHASTSTLLLKSYEHSLSELFGMSKVSVRATDIPYESVAQFAVGHPVKATGTKCERCWRYTSDVGHNTSYPTVCLRCAEALTALNFPPYTT